MSRRGALGWVAALALALTAGAGAAQEPPPPPLAAEPPDELAPPDGPLARPPSPSPSPSPGASAAAPAAATGAAAAGAPATAPARTAAQRATESADWIERGLALEAVGLPLDALGALRRAERAGLGDRGVEAGRRADALGELEEAMLQMGRRRRAPARAALRSALQTLERQRRDVGWPLAPALAAHIAQVAAICGDGRAAKAMAAEARRAVGAGGADGPSATLAFAEARLARRSKLRLARCLGGPERAGAAAVVALPAGLLVSGSAGVGDGEQVWSWLVDDAGHVQRAGGFGADGRDRALAAVADGDDAWIVGETSGPGGGDALVLRVDGRLMPRAQHDIDLGGRERAVAVTLAGDGTPWVLVDAAVADPAGPHRASYVLGLGRDGAPIKRARLPLGRHAFATALVRDKAALLIVGGRGVGESAGGFVRVVDLATAAVDGDEGPDFPGAVLAAVDAGRAGVVALGRAGDGRAARLWLGGRDRRGRWIKPKLLPRGLPSAAVVLAAERRGVLAILRGDAAAAAAAPDNARVVAVDSRGRVKPWLAIAHFDARAMVERGRELVVVGAAEGCGRGGRDGAIAFVAR